MALTNFPNQIQVTLGSAWNPAGPSGLAPNDVVVLTKVSGQEYWTEDGTNTASGTNRLKFVPIDASPYGNFVYLYADNSNNWERLGNASIFSSGAYTFKDVWNGAPFYNWMGAGPYGNNQFTGSWATYNNAVFSAMDAVVAGQDMSVSGNGTTITSGDSTPSFSDHTKFIGAAVGGSSTRTFTIHSDGTDTLTLSGSTPYVSISGTNAADFSVTSAPSNTIASSGSTTFTVTFSPSAAGTRTATLSIASDDADSPYTFSVSGLGGTGFDPEGWNRKVAITIDHTKVGTGGVTNFDFPLTRACFPDEMVSPIDANNAQADGGDIRFSSDSAGTTQLACDIISWEHDTSNGAGDANVQIVVNVPSISDSTDTVIYCWYSSTDSESQPAANTLYGQYSTYDGDTSLLLTAEEDPSGSQPAILDRTENTNHGTVLNGLTTDELDPGRLGNGLTLLGGTGGDEIDGDAIQSPVQVNGGDWHVSFWVKPTNFSTGSGRYYFGSAQKNDDDNYSLGFRIIDQTTNYLAQFELISGGSYIFTATAQPAFDTTNWWRIAFNWGSTGVHLFINGSEVDSDASTATLSTLDWTIFGGSVVSSTQTWLHPETIIDQMRIDHVARSAAWETTRYNAENSPSTFATEGTPEDVGGGGDANMNSIFFGVNF